MSDITNGSKPKSSKKNNIKRRRNKKRRTADVTSSEDSDASSDVSLGTDSDKEDNTTTGQQSVSLQEEDADIKLSDTEADQDKNMDNAADVEMADAQYEGRKRLNEIKLTNSLKEINGPAHSNTQTLGDYNKASQNLDNLDKDLKTKFLQMTFEHYGEDVNQLRDASDFTNKSLVILANALKEGARMFDNDSLKSILE
ncbi:hypothetical protein ACO0RG_002665 [Hanseniaspora osmophila]|uniref:Ribosome assembly protein 3 n=1 Tax=Hanseniaspora osmophila TaxID=56408 RepID=A0A1E5R888_9ASCO|nr:Ribosome assembly protein 3 [Hanseniaspora osmophila]